MLDMNLRAGIFSVLRNPQRLKSKYASIEQSLDFKYSQVERKGLEQSQSHSQASIPDCKFPGINVDRIAREPVSNIHGRNPNNCTNIKDTCFDEGLGGLMQSSAPNSME
jgi:hypothetical protein